MIARLWTARARYANAKRYAAHLEESVLPALRDLAGYRGATLLERHDGEHMEIVVVTWWNTLNDVRAFAGDDTTRAVVGAEARALLEDFADDVRHYDVALDQHASG